MFVAVGMGPTHVLSLCLGGSTGDGALMLEYHYTLMHFVAAILCKLYRQHVFVEHVVHAEQLTCLLQLAGAQHIEDVFSLCFGGVEGDGALMLGDVPPASVNVSLQYTPLVSSLAHPHYYLAKLNDLSVNGSILPVDQVCCKLQSVTDVFLIVV